MEEAVKIDAQYVGVVFVRIFGERLSDENAGIVDERVDAAEAPEGLRHDAFRSLGVGDVAGNRQNVRIGRRLDRAGARDNTEIAFPVTLDKGFADASRRAGDDCDFLLYAHDGPP